MAAPRIIVVGSFVADLMGRGPDLPSPGETLIGSVFRVGPGGKGGNQAVAASRAGAEVAMVTNLGKDSYADMALASFQREGIDVRFVSQITEAPTGAALILVSEKTGQNAILVIPGACGLMTSAQVSHAIEHLLPAQLVVVQLETTVAAVDAALRAAQRFGLRVIFNPAPAGPFPDGFYSLIDYLTPNESEAAALAQVPVRDALEAEAAARILQRRGAKNVVVTLGAGGALVLEENGTSTLVPPFSVVSVDSTGAGDCFNGALALALGEGRGLVEATRFANAAAAISVTRLGTAPSMPVRQEIDAFLLKHPDHPHEENRL